LKTARRTHRCAQRNRPTSHVFARNNPQNNLSLALEPLSPVSNDRAFLCTWMYCIPTGACSLQRRHFSHPCESEMQEQFPGYCRAYLDCVFTLLTAILWSSKSGLNRIAANQRSVECRCESEAQCRRSMSSLGAAVPPIERGTSNS
jgi:hypothetical protein